MDFDEHVNLIIGPNAQGKTNLIEGICLTSIGRSFRTHHDADMIRFGEEEAYVKVECSKELIDTKVEVTINRRLKKSIRKDGNIIRRTSEILDNIIIVSFSPEDLRIVKDEPEKRRRFIDSELAQIKPSYYRILSDYKKTLLQRNTYLKEESVDKAILAVWDEQLIRLGSEMMRLRKEFIDKINVFSGDIHGRITGGKEELTIGYDPNVPYKEGKEEREALFREEMAKSLENDLRLRTTTRGPHKDDMQFFIGGVNVRNFGSQGQQRTCALSLKLAELDFIREETGEEAILLLDDVMSELDEERRAYLVMSLSENQMFITGTDIDEGILEMYEEPKVIRVENGHAYNIEW